MYKQNEINNDDYISKRAKLVFLSTYFLKKNFFISYHSTILGLFCNEVG